MILDLLRTATYVVEVGGVVVIGAVAIWFLATR